VHFFLSETENVNESPDITDDESLCLSMRISIIRENKVGTVFSVLKRKFGESLKARKYRLQVKEIKIKVILYNLSRMILTLSILIFIEEFYKAKNYLN
jgi:hypothetical protein